MPFPEEHEPIGDLDSLVERLDGLMCKRLNALSEQLDATIRAVVKEAAAASQPKAPAAHVHGATNQAETMPTNQATNQAETMPGVLSSNESSLTLKTNAPSAGPPHGFHDDGDEDDGDVVATHWTRYLVIPRTSSLGNFLGIFSTMLILYVATLFPYKLCFLDLNPYVADEVKDSSGWLTFDSIISAAFIFDLFIQFFVSYEDKEGVEVFDLRQIAVRYICQFMFVANAVACMPESWFMVIVRVLSPGADAGDANKAALLLRLQRVTRLVRIVRLVNLSSLLQFDVVRKLLKNSGPRMLVLVVALFWSMHLLGCGWFLVAALHEDSSQAWVFRRSLEAAPPSEQWLTSMYFVLTVFTSVGFGDISAVTISEMLYAGLVMIMGTALNTVFLGEILEMWSERDLSRIELTEATQSIEGFAKHVHLGEPFSMQLEHNARRMRRHVSTGLDTERATKLFNGPFLSRESLPEMAQQAFGGAILKHGILAQLESEKYSGKVLIPNRLVLFLAAMSVEKHFSRGEILFKKGEMASFVYLVTKGTCAYIRDDTANGGQWPYQLLNSGKDCGAYEVLHELGIHISSARCESKCATALALPRREFLALCKDNFPKIFLKLTRMAFLHDMSRRRRLSIWTAPLSYKGLACKMIWTHFSAWKKNELGEVDSIRRWPVWPRMQF